MNNAAPNLGTTRFVDCVNYRIKCTLTDNNGCTVITQLSDKDLKHTQQKGRPGRID